MMTYDELRAEWEEFNKITLPKSYNESKMFKEIWESKQHISELSGKQLLPKGHFKHHWQFLHVLPKGTFPNFKYFKHNILLGLPSEHEKQEQYEVFQERREILNRIYYEVYYNKKF